MGTKNHHHQYTMGISRDSLHKRRATGGKLKPWRKARKHELGRQPANTKLAASKDVRQVRCRGGNIKFRALRLSDGNFSWGSERPSRRVEPAPVRTSPGAATKRGR